jgi:hypothetical protein
MIGMACADEDARVTTCERGRRAAGMLERVPGDIQDEPLLRVERCRAFGARPNSSASNPWNPRSDGIAAA